MGKDADNHDPSMDNIYRLADYQQNGQLPETCKDSMALAFATRYAGELRYVAMWGRWLRYDKGRWDFDETIHVFDLICDLCREVALANDKSPNAVASAKTVAAVERFAKADRRLAATVRQWDTDPRLLNTPGGVVDLRTAVLCPHRPEDYLTKITTVDADPNCPTPLWTAFSHRVTGNDPELIAFLQRMAGYCLTGSIEEHALIFHYGIGANGKSTFFNVLSGILGDYHTTAPIETFIASHNEHHPTDLAGLQSARLVSAIETKEGRHWDESKLKAVTGGEPISARVMRQDSFKYMPQFKVLIAGNHKPALRTVDEAIRRRLHLIPWASSSPSPNAIRSSVRSCGANGRASSPGWCKAACAGESSAWPRPPSSPTPPKPTWKPKTPSRRGSRKTACSISMPGNGRKRCSQTANTSDRDFAVVEYFCGARRHRNYHRDRAVLVASALWNSVHDWSPQRLLDIVSMSSLMSIPLTQPI
jgi:putative DNA primase/helicase